MKKIRWVLLICLLLTGCSQEISLQKNLFTIELGLDVYANPALYVKDAENYDTSKMQVIAVSNGIRKKENRFVSGSTDFLVVGEYDFKLVNGSQTIPFKIKIKDTKPPTYNDNFTEISLPAGSQLDWQDYFQASDLSGVSYEMTPNIDLSQPQNTTVNVKISDRFGNAVEKSILVHIT